MKRFVLTLLSCAVAAVPAVAHAGNGHGHGHGHGNGHHKVLVCVDGVEKMIPPSALGHYPGATLGHCPPPVEPPPPGDDGNGSGDGTSGAPAVAPVVIPTAPSGVEGYGVCAIHPFVVNGHLVAVGEFAQIDFGSFTQAPWQGNIVPANFNASVPKGSDGYGLTCVTAAGSHLSGRLVSIEDGAPADFGAGDSERIYPEYVA